MNILQINVFTILILCILNITKADEEHVHTIQYNENNFAKEIPKYNHFVKFYAPWCGHCQKLQPTWEELAEKFNNENSNIRVAKVDCTVDKQVCVDETVKGFPTIKFFKIGESESVRYIGSRDFVSLSNFVDEQMKNENVKAKTEIPEATEGLVVLTVDNFYDFIKTGKHFVKFHSPHCGHCRKLAPTWDDLANDLKSDARVKISKLDCSDFRPLCTEFDIKGYPSLWWIEDGQKLELYKGSRDLEDLKTYIHRKLEGTATTKEANVKNVIPSLTGENFNDNIQDGVTFVKFFAPWCGFCKKLAPTWDELAKKFADNDSVNIIEIDCTLDVNKELCKKEEIKSFPTIHLYKNGNKISKYRGDRSLKDMTEFVSKYDSNIHNEL